MTEKYLTPGNHNLHIPTTREYHCSFSGLINLSQFNTESCYEGCHINPIARALNFDQKYHTSI